MSFIASHKQGSSPESDGGLTLQPYTELLITMNSSGSLAERPLLWLLMFCSWRLKRTNKITSMTKRIQQHRSTQTVIDMSSNVAPSDFSLSVVFVVSGVVRGDAVKLGVVFEGGTDVVNPYRHMSITDWFTNRLLLFPNLHNLMLRLGVPAHDEISHRYGHRLKDSAQMRVLKFHLSHKMAFLYLWSWHTKVWTSADWEGDSSLVDLTSSTLT